MKNLKPIMIPKGVKYLSQLTDENTQFKLPHNALFDKGKVGCGGTSVAIESDKPYIIAVPFVTLIESKLSQYPNERYDGEVYGFYGGHNLKANLLNYIESVSVPKIFVTYDSLAKLTDWINPSEYNILIDELHLLFTEYSYRSKAILEVLEVYKEYNSYCFMTATPLEEEFMLEELKEVPTIKAVWEDTTPITVQSVKVNGRVKVAVINLVEQFLKNKYEGNAYFFVNSVSYIKEIVAHCNLDESNTRVIYSKNNKTEVGIERGSITDEPKKINFITSTAFEGADIYDEDGLTFIVSDSSLRHTLTDISTKFQQIAGRIRNSKYSHTIYHIFKNTRYSELSYEAFKEYTELLIKQTRNFINDTSGKDYLERLKDNAIDKFYLQREGNNLIFDANKVKIDLYNYKISRNIYSLRANLLKEYEKYNYSVENYDLLAEEIDMMSKDTMTFKDYVLAVKDELEHRENNQYYLADDIVEDAYMKYPFLQRAIQVLGFKEIEKSNYVIINIKDKLVRKSDEGKELKILEVLNNKFNPTAGDFITNAEAKILFTKIYNVLEIKATAKGTDILKYYNVKASTKRINGKQCRGYMILGKKLIINITE